MLVEVGETEKRPSQVVDSDLLYLVGGRNGHVLACAQSREPLPET